MQRTSLIRLATIASFNGLLASAAMAQEAPQPSAPTYAAQQHNRQQQDKTHYLQQKQTQRWERMKNLLQLQPQQQAAWDTYVAAMQPAARPQAQKHPKDMTTLERLEWKSQMRKTYQQNAEQRDQATRKFYTSLNAQQQKAFDSLHQDGKRMLRKHRSHPKM